MHPDATSTGSAGPIVERFTKLAFRKKAGASRERRRNNIGKDMQEGHDRLASMLLYESSHGFDKERYIDKSRDVDRTPMPSCPTYPISLSSAQANTYGRYMIIRQSDYHFDCTSLLVSLPFRLHERSASEDLP